MNTSLIRYRTIWSVTLLVLALVGGNVVSPVQAALSTCPLDGSPGVYLYGDPNYGGACSYFAFAAQGTSGSPDPTTWAVGDNNASSMRVIMPPAPSGSSSSGSSSQSATVTLYDGFMYTSALLSWSTSKLLAIPDFGMSKLPINNRASSISIQLKQQVSTCQQKCP